MTEFYDCTTVMMGKYVENLKGQHLYDYEEQQAKHFAEAFALWYEFEYFDEKTNWLIIKISYSKDHFFKEELLATIKFFMQFNGYSLVKTFGEHKPID